VSEPFGLTTPVIVAVLLVMELAEDVVVVGSTVELPTVTVNDVLAL
jgi:hypothetical protein